MSVICHNFVQNTWKKDLCSNCFKSSAEHSHAETRNNELLNFINGGVTNPLSGSNGEILGRYMSQATTVYQSRNLQGRAWPSLIIDQKSAVKSTNLSMKLPATCLTDPIKVTDPPPPDTKEKTEKSIQELEKDEEDISPEILKLIQIEKKESKPTVRFHEEEVLVIGYGGNDYDPNDPTWEMNSDDDEDWVFETMDNTTEERIITRVTKENTEFNADNNNLLKDPAKEDDMHCLNVKNAVSMLEGRANKTNGSVNEKPADANIKVRGQTLPMSKPVPEAATKLDCGESYSKQKLKNKQRRPKATNTKQTPSTTVEENATRKIKGELSEKNSAPEVKEEVKGQHFGNNCNQKAPREVKNECLEKEQKIQHQEQNQNSENKADVTKKVEQEKTGDFPVYSVVSKTSKSVDPVFSEACTCPDVIPEISKGAQRTDEPYYKVPTENNKINVPQAEVAEFLNYDVPTKSSPDANEHNFIDDLRVPHYDEIKSLEHSQQGSEDVPIDFPPELPTTPPPNGMPQIDTSTSEQIAAHIGITPTAQSSFLHKPRPQELETACNNPREEDSSVESDSSSKYFEEATTTTNPIYTPTNIQSSSDSDSSAKHMSKSKPKVPEKPSSLAQKSGLKPSSDSDYSAKSDDRYDTVEWPQERVYEEEVHISCKENCEIYQDVAAPHQPVANDAISAVEGDLSKHRNGSSKRQAPPPPQKTPSKNNIPLNKKSQRHSMTLAKVGASASNSKLRSNTLAGFQKIRIGNCRHSEENEPKKRKGKFWKRILNRFSRDGVNMECGRQNNSQDDQKAKLAKTSSDGSAKKVRLQIIHPIDFEQSGGPQIIESPAITTAEDGMPSVIDCASPASSICSGASPASLSDDNATSSDSGGNYESVGEEEDSSTGHNCWASQDEQQSSDYFEASQSDSSGGEMYHSAGKPHASARIKSNSSDGRRSQGQAPNRPPPPKILNSASPNGRVETESCDSSNASSALAQNYANSSEIQAAMATMKEKPVQPLPEDNGSDEETKRRRAPSPPKNNTHSSSGEQHTYQNLQQVKICTGETSAYYEPLEVRRDQSNTVGRSFSGNSSSPTSGTNLETVCNSNDAKSTDSGFIDFSKPKTGSSNQGNDQNDGGHHYEKIESTQSSPRSISPEDTITQLRERQRNPSGFSDNSSKASCKRLASLTLEENYGNIVCTNHETLACILDNVQRVKSPHPFLRKATNLRWQDFDLDSEEPLFSFKRTRAMFRACYRGPPETAVTLMISKDSSYFSPSGNAPFILRPLAQFADTIPARLFPGNDYTDQMLMIPASIWVLDNIQVSAILGLSLGTNTIEERRIFFIMLQLITALKFLQAHGIEELDNTLDSFLVNLTDNHLFVFGDASVQLQQGRQRETGPKLSLCHAAISSMLYLLRDSPNENIIEICEESIQILNEPKYALFSPIANVLIKEKAVSLSQAKSLLEYVLWGPPESSFDRQDFCSNEDLEIVIQRWLDQERANFLSNLVRTVNTSSVQSLQLSVYDEYKLIFLVRSSAKTLREASNILEPEVTIF